MSSKLLGWRRAEGFSQPEVSGLTGVSVAMLSRLERGQRQASPRLKVRMARRLGVPVSDLFEVEPLAEEADAKEPVA
ncbi:MAG: helix-turn-helix transcriptional regulator [Actinobacteria bacterium]|nr:helix-turn-helix transcriptional regulator [Actinomycetota bacterium]